jgi:hypothetical protein
MGLSILGPAAWVNAIAGIAVFFVFIYIVRRRKSKTEAGIRPLSTRRLAMAQQGKGGTPAKPLSVCIIGGGISGCGSAAFLREMMAPGDLEISVLEAGSILGGRVGLVDFDGRKYEVNHSHSSGSTLPKFPHFLPQIRSLPSSATHNLIAP